MDSRYKAISRISGVSDIWQFPKAALRNGELTRLYSKLFSDLTHYVRSGDFILALLRDSKDLDGYAFALGALSHYAADNEGHLIGVNRAVPILYPNLKKKYGDLVTYEESPLAHGPPVPALDAASRIADSRGSFDAYKFFSRPTRIRQGRSLPILPEVDESSQSNVFDSNSFLVSSLSKPVQN